MTQLDQKFKADAGKLKARLLFEGCPRALLAACAVLSYGAQKYEAHSWKNVGMDRYSDAFYRHLLDRECGLGSDIESGLPHEFHELVNKLFLVEDMLSKLTEEEFREILKFNPPPTGHKEIQ